MKTTALRLDEQLQIDEIRVGVDLVEGCGQGQPLRVPSGVDIDEEDGAGVQSCLARVTLAELANVVGDRSGLF
ncbi:MAG: hypothetical protein HYS06_09070 [Methylocystis sp.]|nr:hypothetical protein [Methylocystis sp.]